MNNLFLKNTILNFTKAFNVVIGEKQHMCLDKWHFNQFFMKINIWKSLAI